MTFYAAPYTVECLKVVHFLSKNEIFTKKKKENILCSNTIMSFIYDTDVNQLRVST